MEEETNTLLAIVAIGIGILAIIGCGIVYTAIPETEANPVTWGAIEQYNTELTTLQNNIADVQGDVRALGYEIDDVEYNIDKDDIDDLEEYANEFWHIEDNQDDIKDIINCLSEDTYENFSSCVI